jgi:signal transduction histidine kinase
LGRGLGRFHQGSLKVFRRAEGLPSDYLWSLHVSRDGTLWIGTYDRGLVRLRDGRFSLIGTAQGLPGDMVGQILEDHEGALWLGTNGGIARVARVDLDRCADGEIRRIAAESFDLTDGLSTLGLAGGAQNTACHGPDGSLWFATEKGLARLDPRQSRPIQLPPPVAIEAYRIDGVETLVVGTAAPPVMTVPPGSRRLEIDYTGLSLSAPHRIRFRYRLDEVDADWTEAETRRTAYFSYLRPGHYTFRVQAVQDNNTRPAPDATLRLRIVPFFRETTWFVVLASASALLLVAGVVSAILRVRHRRRLEQIARAQAIERDRTRIAHDLHDKIGSGLTELSFLSHSALAATAEPERVAAHIREIQGTTNEMTEAIDEIVWAVNPSHDSLESLLSYLGRSVQEFAQHTGLQCHIDVPIDREHVGVTAEVRHELYLALREALHNVVKHAGATAVWFALRRTGTELCFLLEDNGRGLPDRPTDDAASRSGVGLESMQQRMARLGGSVTWSSRTGGGTVIAFRIRGPATSVASPEVVT